MENIPTSLYESVCDPDLNQFLDTYPKSAAQQTQSHLSQSSHQPHVSPHQPLPCPPSHSTPMNTSPGPATLASQSHPHHPASAPTQSHPHHPAAHSQPFTTGEYKHKALVMLFFLHTLNWIIELRVHRFPDS